MLEVQYGIRDVMLAMRRCPQPIIAILHGAASGGGFAMALASDIRLGTPDLRMNAAAIKLGLTGGDMGISYFLPRMIGSSAAAEYLLTGRFLEAQRAMDLELLSRIRLHGNQHTGDSPHNLTQSATVECFKPQWEALPLSQVP